MVAMIIAICGSQEFNHIGLPVAGVDNGILMRHGLDWIYMRNITIE